MLLFYLWYIDINRTSISRFKCMELFEQDEVDLITLEAGQGYFAGRYHSMRPIVAEKYDTGKYLS